MNSSSETYLRLLVRRSLLRESSQSFTLGYGDNEPTQEEHTENTRLITRWFEEVREELIGCSKEKVGRTREEGLYGDLHADGVSFNDWVENDAEMIRGMNAQCASPIFGTYLVNDEANPLTAFLMRVFIARTNLVLISGPNDPNWGTERGHRDENAAALFRHNFPARVPGGSDTRRQIDRHLSGAHNTVYYYMYGRDVDRARSIGEDGTKDTLFHEFGHARQMLTQGIGQALISVWGELSPTLEDIDTVDRVSLIEDMVDPDLWSAIPVNQMEGFDDDTIRFIDIKWKELGGSKDVFLDIVIDRLEGWMYSKNEVHNIISNDLKRRLVQVYGPIPNELLRSQDEWELRDWYADRLDELLSITPTSQFDIQALGYPSGIEVGAYLLLLRSSLDTSGAFGSLAMLTRDEDSTPEDA